MESHEIESPKLRQAMNEIEMILEKHDIAGMIVLHTPGHSVFRVKIDPSYSVARLVSNGIRLKTNPKDDPKTKEQQLGDTANMFTLLAETTSMVAMQLIEVSRNVDHYLGAVHEAPLLGAGLRLINPGPHDN